MRAYAQINRPARKTLPACCAATLLASLVSLSGAVADLSLTEGSSTASVSVGTPFTYTLTVRNTGPDTATDVTLTDLLPAVVNLVSVQSDFGSCARSPNGITCHLDSLTAGAAATDAHSQFYVRWRNL